MINLKSIVLENTRINTFKKELTDFIELYDPKALKDFCFFLSAKGRGLPGFSPTDFNTDSRLH